VHNKPLCRNRACQTGVACQIPGQQRNKLQRNVVGAIQRSTLIIKILQGTGAQGCSMQCGLMCRHVSRPAIAFATSCTYR
jgi:hypothetical protein